MKKKLRIGVLFGGRSSEHEVSINSATSVIQHLDPEKYDIIPIAIKRDGTWLLGIHPQQLLALETSSDESGQSLSIPRVTLTSDPHFQRLVSLDGNTLPDDDVFDVIFPVLHGTYGEDGTLQGLLEMACIPYVGCGVFPAALGMDKEKTKIVVRGLGLPVVDWIIVRRLNWERSPEAILTDVEQHFNYPCFVKPVNGGSSIGISKVRTREQLRQAIDEASKYDRRVVIEPGVNCREFSCAVMGNEEPLASVVGEVVAGHDFNDYNDKYVDNKSQFIIPSHLPQEQAEAVRNMALQVYQGLDLNGLARVDFFLDKDTNQFYLNEVNTMPGMGLYLRLWTASGLPYPQLLDNLITLAFERFEDRQLNSTLL